MLASTDIIPLEQAEKTMRVVRFEWQDPDWSMLDDRRGDLPEFPLEVLSPRWREWVVLTSHGAGVMPDHVMVPLLSIASSMIGAARRIRASRSWSEPLSLWTAIVGFSGTGKTPGLAVTTRVLSAIERDRRSKVADLRRKHDGRVEVARAAEKQWKAAVSKAVEEGVPAPPMSPDAVNPGEFVAPRLYASDVTTERLAVLLQARPRGIVMVCDELAGLFLNMNRYSNGSDREFWLKSWNGQDHVVERQGRPAVVLEHLMVGLTGGFQPDKLSKCFHSDDDGMYARCLFSWPAEPIYRPLSNDVSEIEPEFQNALTRIADLHADDGEGGFVPKDIWLDSGASRAFEQFRHFSHRKKETLDAREREWVAKAQSQVLRLAGALAYLEWGMIGGDEPECVEARFMSAAIALWKNYFHPHARAALRQVGLSDGHVNARRVLSWIRTNEKTEVSAEDIRRDALNQRINADETTALLDAMAKANWFTKVTTKTAGRSLHRWIVNPVLYQEVTAGSAGSAGSAQRTMGDDRGGNLAALPALPADPHSLSVPLD